MLRIENLVAGYGELEILHGISMEVRQGNITCLIGPNGSGKSTLLSALFGLVKPWQGEIMFEERPITGAKPEKLLEMGIAYVLQRRSVFPELTVYENLQMGAYIRNDSDIEADIERVYDIFPVLKRKSNDPAHAMSGGEQRMLELGRALMTNPKLLLLDEPSAGLAPKVIDEIFDVLKSLTHDDQLTLVIVEQNVQRVLEFADYGYLLNNGVIDLEGNCEQLLNDEDLVSAYLKY